MDLMASQITSLTIVYSTVYSRHRSKKTSKLRVTGLCEGNSPVTSEFPAQRASNTENVSIWWCHHAVFSLWTSRKYWVETAFRCSLKKHDAISVLIKCVNSGLSQINSEYPFWCNNFDALVQDCCISIANALEILQSYTEPSVYSKWNVLLWCIIRLYCIQHDVDKVQS